MINLNHLRIVFFGTPDFAVASLKAMVDAGLNVVAVVTAPDKPAGRGMQLQSSAVKLYSLSVNIPVLQPPKLKEESFLAELKSFQAHIQVVVAFRMLPEVVWNMPPMGTVNVHASLLPQYRGAAPINWAIINGENETGVTTFKLKHEIDTGNILLQQKVQILEEDNAGTLHDKLMHEGAALLLKTLAALANDSLSPIPQQEITKDELKHAPKLFKEHMLIHWGQASQSVHNLIRGLSPYPAAFTILNGKTLKIYESSFQIVPQSLPAGTPDSDGVSYLRFACSDGWLSALQIQLEGKKKMDIQSFLRGYRL
jgi:methionyl-tRNA formyltransferase